MFASTLTLLLAAAQTTPGLAVMDFAVEGAPPEIAAATSGLVSHELERLQLFRVNTAEMTRVILGVERQRMLLGCEDCSGNTFSELTSVEYLVTGKLIRRGTPKDPTYTLSLTLLKTGSAAPQSSVRVEAKGEEKLLQEVPPATLKLVGKLLEGRQGALVVSSSEVGAAVKVDDTQVGTTPLQSRVPVAAGPHLLTVEKDGFSLVRKEVKVTPDQVTDEYVKLVPSPDMAEAYEARATRFRVLAWVATGLAVAGVATAIGTNVAANNLYGDPLSNTPSFSYYKALLNAGDEGENGVNRNQANSYKAQIETMQALSWVGIGTAGLAGIAATVLFVVGDPPGRYDAYRLKTKVITMSLSPTLGGAVVRGSF